MFQFFFKDAVKGDLAELTEAFWNPVAAESEERREALSYTLPPFDFNLGATSSSKKRVRGVVQQAKTARFDLGTPTKKSVIISPNGLGKTVLLNLFQHKLHMLIQRDPEYYNIAVFRHQVGYINTTTLFSAWFCQLRQTLYSIAKSIAASGDAAAVAALHAMDIDDCTPLLEFLKVYLPPNLQPFTSLLSMVGIKFKASGAEVATSPTAASLGSESIDPTGDHAPAPESGKTDPMSTLDAAEKLQRCADLVVAIVKLHVKITRKLTVYVM